MNSPASTPPRTFIAGASGYTGQALVRICREAGALSPDHLLILITVNDRAGLAPFSEFKRELMAAFGQLGLN